MSYPPWQLLSNGTFLYIASASYCIDTCIELIADVFFSFCCLANATGSGSGATTVKKDEDGAADKSNESKDELAHGSQMEVEVLLFQFKQPVSSIIVMDLVLGFLLCVVGDPIVLMKLTLLFPCNRIKDCNNEL